MIEQVGPAYNRVFAAPAPLRSPPLEMAFVTAAAVVIFRRASRATARSRRDNPGFSRDGHLANTRYVIRNRLGGDTMRLSLIILLSLIMILPVIVSGQEAGYIFQTSDETHSMWCISGSPQYFADIWFWSIHSPEGLIGAEFDVQYPSNVIPDTLIMNDAVVTSAEGSLPGGIRIQLSECQMSFVWLCKQRIHVIDAEQTAVALRGHPETGLIRLSICEEGYPYKTCWSCSLLVNYTELMEECQAYEPYGLPCAEPVGVKGSTWGAIKSIYK